MILLTDEEIATTNKEALRLSWTHKPHPRFEVDKFLLETQLKKMVDLLEQKTVKAWGGNRIILSEDWEAIVKECE